MTIFESLGWRHVALLSWLWLLIESIKIQHGLITSLKLPPAVSWPHTSYRLAMSSMRVSRRPRASLESLITDATSTRSTFNETGEKMQNHSLWTNARRPTRRITAHQTGRSIQTCSWGSQREHKNQPPRSFSDQDTEWSDLGMLRCDDCVGLKILLDI